jgi:hypothetical protein
MVAWYGGRTELLVATSVCTIHPAWISAVCVRANSSQVLPGSDERVSAWRNLTSEPSSVSNNLPYYFDYDGFVPPSTTRTRFVLVVRKDKNYRFTQRFELKTRDHEEPGALSYFLCPGIPVTWLVASTPSISTCSSSSPHSDCPKPYPKQPERTTGRQPSCG